MPTVIYRVTDREVVGVAFPPQPVALEVQNILASELGGVAQDYGTVDTQLVAGTGELYSVGADLRVRLIANPAVAADALLEAQLNARLLSLGFSQSEIAHLRSKGRG